MTISPRILPSLCVLLVLVAPERYAARAAPATATTAFASTPTAFTSTKTTKTAFQRSTLSPNRDGGSAPSARFARAPPLHAVDGEATNDPGLVRRRSVLTSFAASAFFPFLAVTSLPDGASAKGPDTSKGLVFGSEDLMSQKEHGTTATGVQDDLRYGVSRKVADRICSYNRHFAEMGGSWESTTFEKDMKAAVAATGNPVTFYDSVTGKPLFRAPVDRSVDNFLAESRVHGWPSFRDAETIWTDVRILKDGETVSAAGTHLGHNLPDGNGNRYCINLVCIAGNPTANA